MHNLVIFIFQGQDIEELKKELELDGHKISIEELCKRLGTNPKTVSWFLHVFYTPHQLT